jgi:hypothetical protein
VDSPCYIAIDWCHSCAYRCPASANDIDKRMELYGACWRGNSILLIAIHIHNRNSDLLHRFNAWQNLDKRFLSFSLLFGGFSYGKEKAMDPEGN